MQVRARARKNRVFGRRVPDSGSFVFPALCFHLESRKCAWGDAFHREAKAERLVKGLLDMSCETRWVRDRGGRLDPKP